MTETSDDTLDIINDKIVLSTLTEEQVDMGIDLVEQRHPLKYTLLWITLPYLQPIKHWMPSWVPRTKERIGDAQTVFRLNTTKLGGSDNHIESIQDDQQDSITTEDHEDDINQSAPLKTLSNHKTEEQEGVQLLLGAIKYHKSAVSPIALHKQSTFGSDRKSFMSRSHRMTMKMSVYEEDDFAEVER